MFSKLGVHWYVFTADLDTNARRFGGVKDYCPHPTCAVINLAVTFVWHLQQEVRIFKASCGSKLLLLLFIVSVS